MLTKLTTVGKVIIGRCSCAAGFLATAFPSPDEDPTFRLGGTLWGRAANGKVQSTAISCY